MHPLRLYGTLFVLLPVALTERAIWYAVRSSNWMLMMERGGLEYDQLGELFQHMFWASGAATLVGGVLALVAGPLPVIVLGFVIISLACGLGPIVEPEHVMWTLLGAALGGGLVRPAIWAALIRPFSRPHEASRNAVCFTIWVLGNSAAMASPAAAGVLQNTVGVDSVFYLAAVAAMTCAFAACALAAGWVVTRSSSKAAEPDPATRWDGRVIGVAVALVLLTAIPWNGVESVLNQLWPIFYESPPGGISPEIWSRLNPMVAVWAGLLGGAVCVVLVMIRRNLPTLPLIGLGLLAGACGVGILSFEAVRTTAVGLGLGVLVLTVGEVLAGPMLLSRIGGDAHWRVSTLLIAAWLTLGQLVWMVQDGTGDDPVAHPWLIPGVCAVVAALVGVAVVVAAIPLQRRLYSPDRPDPPLRR